MFNLIRHQTTSSLFRNIMRFGRKKQEMQTKLATRISQKFKDSQVNVQDMSQGCAIGLKFNIYVQSEAFFGKSLVQQHQMVKSALFRELKHIQYLNIKTKIKLPPEKTSPPNAPGGGGGQDRRIMDGSQAHSQHQGDAGGRVIVQGGRADISIPTDSGSGNI